MKKSVSLLLAGAMCAGLLAGCSSSSTSGGASAAASGSTAPSSVVSGEAGSKSIEKLSIDRIEHLARMGLAARQDILRDLGWK